jgi:hypothetical protein
MSAQGDGFDRVHGTGVPDRQPLGSPIRKPAEAPPGPPDVQVSPGIWRRADGTMYTKNHAPGNVPPTPKKKPEPVVGDGAEDGCEYDDWLGAC